MTKSELIGVECEFLHLTQPQKELLLYRKILESGLRLDHETGMVLGYQPELDIGDIFHLANSNQLSFFRALLVQSENDLQKFTKKIYKNSIMHYNKILENYRNLAEDLGVKSSLELSQMFTYMLWNGYYSANKTHSYNLKKRLLLSGLQSFDVMKGSGVCFGYANLLRDYLNTCGKDAALSYCFVSTNKKDFQVDYRPNIERNIKMGTGDSLKIQLEAKFLKGLIKNFGNHVITLFDEDGEITVFDPTMICSAKVESASKASLINGHGDYGINPISSLLVDTESDPHHVFEKLLKGEIHSNLTREQYENSFEAIMELMENNRGLLDYAYDNIHGDLEFIDKQTDEIGDHSEVQKLYQKYIEDLHADHKKMVKSFKV